MRLKKSQKKGGACLISRDACLPLSARDCHVFRWFHTRNIFIFLVLASFPDPLWIRFPIFRNIGQWKPERRSIHDRQRKVRLDIPPVLGNRFIREDETIQDDTSIIECLGFARYLLKQAHSKPIPSKVV